MCALVDGSPGAEGPGTEAGWGDVPVADRPLWARAMIAHCPWFPGAIVMTHLAPRVVSDSTRAPQIWQDTARSLHAAGFTPSDYSLLAGLLTDRIEQLDLHRHAPLFELWPTDGVRRPRTFRLNAVRWTPWLDGMRAGEPPRRALERILAGGAPR